MKTIDYDQVARFEAASELINTLRGILRSLINSNPEYTLELQNRGLELLREKQHLRTKNNVMVKEIRDTYGPLVRSYYDDPKAFNLSKSFLETKISYAN